MGAGKKAFLRKKVTPIFNKIPLEIMNSFEFISYSEKETVALGARLAKHLAVSDIVALFGDLGSGKTTLVKAMAKGLKIKPNKICSPTFVLMNIYDGRLPVYHFDFYRLDDVQEMNLIGCHEFFYGDGVCVIEWAERLGKLMPKEYLGIKLQHQNINERRIQCTAHGKRYQKFLEILQNQ